MKVRLAWVIVFSGSVLFASVVSSQDATEIKPFVGKWRTYVAAGGASTPVEITVQRDGSYSSIMYTQPPRSTQGRLEIVDGKFRFRSSDGSAGAVSLIVDSKGKKFLKAVRDGNPRAVEYEEVK